MNLSLGTIAGFLFLLGQVEIGNIQPMPTLAPPPQGEPATTTAPQAGTAQAIEISPATTQATPPTAQASTFPSPATSPGWPFGVPSTAPQPFGGGTSSQKFNSDGDYRVFGRDGATGVTGGAGEAGAAGDPESGTHKYSKLDAVGWGSILIFVVVVGGGIVMFIRRKMQANAAAAGQDAGFSLAELKAMRDRGEITIQEYDRTKARVIKKVKAKLAEDEARRARAKAKSLDPDFEIEAADDAANPPEAPPAPDSPPSEAPPGAPPA